MFGQISFGHFFCDDVPNKRVRKGRILASSSSYQLVELNWRNEFLDDESQTEYPFIFNATSFPVTFSKYKEYLNVHGHND